jgi:ribokinase
MKDIRIIVVGSTNMDMVVHAHRLPLPGETVLGGDLIMAAGGKGANQAVAAARLGARVTFIARIGRDMFGKQALENFQREGLDPRYIIEDPDAPSGVALITVGPAGQNIITVAPGANNRLLPEDITRAAEVFAPARVVILQLETPIETVLQAARQAKATGAFVILNPAPAPTIPLPAELYQLIDLITPNETEAHILTGESSPESAARVLLDRKVASVIITLGKDGALLANGSQPLERIPGFSVKAVDTVAAGDCFNGALACALAEGQSLPQAIRFSHAAAAVSVTKPGAQPSLPTRNEVEAFLAEQNR